MLVSCYYLGKSQGILLLYGLKNEEICEIVDTHWLHSGSIGVVVLKKK